MPKDPAKRSDFRLPAQGRTPPGLVDEFVAIDRAIEGELYDEAWERVRAILARDPHNEEAKLRRLYLEALEQRRAKRVSQDMVLFLERSDGTDWPCRLVDISTGGMRVKTARTLVNGEGLRLVLKQQAAKEEAPKVPCRVAWTRPDSRGCTAGLEFNAGTEADQKCIRLLVEIALSPKARAPHG